MKDIKIKEIHIENFKGCKKQDIIFTDVTNIFGANASGKTTVVDSFNWLLFDTNSKGETKFDIRPLDIDGNMINNIEISVECILEVDGTNIILKKVQKQNWVKQRGTGTVSFNGNKNEYWINTFPVTQAEYKKYVDGIVDKELFWMVTDPNAFVSLPWKKQREQLIKMVSNVTDADVMKTDAERYEFIKDELAIAPIDKCVEKAKKEMTLLKKKQDELPTRIDEANRSMVEVEDKNFLINKRIKVLEEIEKVNNVSAISEERMAKTKELSDDMFEKKQKALDYVHKKETEHNIALYEIKSRRDKLSTEVNDYSKAKLDAENKISSLRMLIEVMTNEKTALADDWKTVKAETLSEDAFTCPTCGQILPSEKMEEIKESFATKKENRLKKIVKEGNALNEKIAEKTKMIEDTEEVFKSVAGLWEQKKAEIDTLDEKLKEYPQKYDFGSDAEYMEMLDVYKKAEALYNAYLESASSSSSTANTDALKEELNRIEKQIMQCENNESVAERIEELQHEQRTVAQQVATQEHKIDLLEEFLRKKMDMLSDSINDKFHFVKFKLFENQINGGMKDCCEAVVAGVPYGSLNSAAKMMAGIDIINSLCQLYEITAPIWLDNRESVTSIPQTKSQIINLYVSPDDEKLRVENI